MSAFFRMFSYLSSGILIINNYYIKFIKTHLKNEYNLIILGLGIIILYFSPYVFLGKNSSLLIPDNLDSNLVWVKILLTNGGIFSSPNLIFDQIMNGLPRSSVYGTYDISLIWFKIFGIYWGYVVNKFLIGIIAFVGMFFLLKVYFLKNKESFINFGVALIFAFLPFWSFTITIAGLPILFYAFLNIRNGKKSIIDWIILIFFPFYSSLILSGFFIMFIFLLILIYDIIKLRRINYYSFASLCFLAMGYIISHFPLFFDFFFNDDFVSHRKEFKTIGINFNGAVVKSIDMFLLGQWHAYSLQRYISIPVLIFSIILLKDKRVNLKFLSILVFIIITSLFYGFIDWTPFLPFKNQLNEIIPIQFDRFHFLHPMFWYIILGISLVGISRNIRNKNLVLGSFLLLQLMYVLSFHELYKNRNSPSFSDFYSVEQFNAIEKFIGKPKESYRTISIGIYPGVSQYNGFYTLDGYSSSYPLQYKHQFRKIICSELDKDLKLKQYFDNWGSRAYIFTTELGKNYDDFFYKTVQPVNNLQIDFKEVKKMGGDYIISVTEIKNRSENIDLIQTFKGTAYSKIYLYYIY